MPKTTPNDVHLRLPSALGRLVATFARIAWRGQIREPTWTAVILRLIESGLRYEAERMAEADRKELALPAAA